MRNQMKVVGDFPVWMREFKSVGKWYAIGGSAEVRTLQRSSAALPKEMAVATSTRPREPAWDWGTLRLPRVKEQDPCRFKIGGVSRHDVKTVMQRGSGDQSIRGAHHAPRLLRTGSKFSPPMADITVNGEDPIAIVFFQGVQPACQDLFSPAFREERNTLQDFTDGDNTQEEVFFIEGGHGTANPRMALEVA